MTALKQGMALADGRVLDHDFSVGIAAESIHLPQQLDLPTGFTVDVKAKKCAHRWRMASINRHSTAKLIATSAKLKTGNENGTSSRPSITAP